MPSKGNPIVRVRMDEELIDAVELQIASRNVVASEAPWTFSDFVRVACWEKLQKMERSRESAKRRASARRDAANNDPAPDLVIDA